jgi:hypothetical protein
MKRRTGGEATGAKQGVVFDATLREKGSFQRYTAIENPGRFCVETRTSRCRDRGGT